MTPPVSIGERSEGRSEGKEGKRFTSVVVPSSTPSRSICREKLLPLTLSLSLWVSCLLRQQRDVRIWKETQSVQP